jgi:hypothetical protein
MCEAAPSAHVHMMHVPSSCSSRYFRFSGSPLLNLSVMGRLSSRSGSGWSGRQGHRPKIQASKTVCPVISKLWLPTVYKRWVALSSRGRLTLSRSADMAASSRHAGWPAQVRRTYPSR